MLTDDRWRSELTVAEKIALRDKLAALAAREGIRIPHPVRGMESPGDLMCRLNPRQMVQRANLRLIDDELMWLHRTPGGKLMIWQAPQSGKSMRVSRAFPFWWLVNEPTDRIALGSYALQLALTHARAVRVLIEQYGAQFALLPSREEWAAADWTLLSGGGMRSRGVGGGLTGHPANLIIIDDPYKDRQQADSPLIRANVWDWYSSVIQTRKAPGAREVITHTRWHQNDLSGELLKREGRIEDGGKWKVLHLPAIAVDPDPERGFGEDPLGRKAGEPLPHPDIPEGDEAAEREHWATKREAVTIRDWGSMYQGAPSTAEGTLLDAGMVRDRTSLPPALWRRNGVGIDPSGGGRDTCGIVAGGVDLDGRTWWLQDWTAVMSSAIWPLEACKLAAEVDADCFVVETNFGGDQATTLVRQAWVELIRQKKIEANRICPRVIPVVSRKNKVLRAEPIAQAVQMDRCRFAPGLNDLSTEWTLWEPGSTWSPGSLDAAVHLATELLPPIAQGTKVVSVAGRSRQTEGNGGSLTAARLRR